MRCVAKTLRPDRRGDERARARARARGRRLVELTHPHIVRGYELLTEPELVAIETLDGETVAHLVDPSDGLPADVCWLGIHVASALATCTGAACSTSTSSVQRRRRGRSRQADRLSVAYPPGRDTADVGTRPPCTRAATRRNIPGPADTWALGALLLEAAHRPRLRARSRDLPDARHRRARHAGDPQLEGRCPGARRAARRRLARRSSARA